MWHIVFHISCERFERTSSREMKFFFQKGENENVASAVAIHSTRMKPIQVNELLEQRLASCCWLSHFMWITPRRVYSVRSTISKTFTCESTAASPIVIIYRMKEKEKKCCASEHLFCNNLLPFYRWKKKEGPWKTKKKVKAVCAISVNNYLGWFLYRFPQWGKFYFFTNEIIK